LPVTPVGFLLLSLQLLLSLLPMLFLLPSDASASATCNDAAAAKVTGARADSGRSRREGMHTQGFKKTRARHLARSRFIRRTSPLLASPLPTQAF